MYTLFPSAFVLLVAFVGYCSCAPVHSDDDHPVVYVLCGDRVVRHAKVYIYEEDNELQLMKTNHHGSFIAEFLETRHHQKLQVEILDACEIPTKMTCNLPYHRYRIPMSKFFNHGSINHVLDLADNKYDRFKITECL